jgi:hypothetical protein
MIDRELEPKILAALGQFPCVALLGARQVGKTTLARRVAAAKPGAVFLDLERPSDAAKLAEPELFLGPLADRLVVLDEIQRVPELFPVLRSLVDAGARAGRFLILGSAAPALLRQSSETLAGRVRFFELAPLALREVKPPPEAVPTLWLRGGFPRSFLAQDERQSLDWREAFIQTFLERDIPAFGIRVPAANLRRFWQMLAHSHGQLWNASRLASGFGVSPPTMQHYLDILEDAFMLRQLRPLQANLGKRLVKSPRIYLRDSGLLHALLGIDSIQSLQGHPALGASFEGWVMEQIIAAAPQGWDWHFYRTAAGAEIDLVLRRARQTVVVEIKFSAAPKPAKGFWSALEDLKPQRAFVVAPVREGYPLSGGVQVLPVLECARVFG